ncbi:hypothetical protein ACIPYS_21510 [Kitasatospora sp. NPDC089913]
MFVLPQRLTWALADAGSTELEELADRWATRPVSAVSTGAGLYSWSF